MPRHSLPKEKILVLWENVNLAVTTEQNREMFSNYIRSVYDLGMDLNKVVLNMNACDRIKSYIECILKMLNERAGDKNRTVDDKRDIVESNMKVICEGLAYCIDGQLSGLNRSYCILMGQADMEEATLREIVYNHIADVKENVFDKVFTPPDSGQNVHILNFWKFRLRNELGFDFDFRSQYGSLGQDPYRAHKGNALEAYFAEFTPESIISSLLDKTNSTNTALCLAGKYIQDLKMEDDEKQKFFIAEDNDIEYLEKVTREFIVHYLVAEGILTEKIQRKRRHSAI